MDKRPNGLPLVHLLHGLAFTISYQRTVLGIEALHVSETSPAFGCECLDREGKPKRCASYFSHLKSGWLPIMAAADVAAGK